MEYFFDRFWRQKVEAWLAFCAGEAGESGKIITAGNLAIQRSIKKRRERECWRFHHRWNKCVCGAWNEKYARLLEAAREFFVPQEVHLVTNSMAVNLDGHNLAGKERVCCKWCTYQQYRFAYLAVISKEEFESKLPADFVHSLGWFFSFWLNVP